MKTRLAAALAGLLVSPGWSLAATAQQGDWHDHPHMWGGGWLVFGPVMMILFLVVAVVAVVLVLRWLGGHAPQASAPPGNAPLDILKARFARGEIDKEEFEDRRRVLGD